MMFGLRHRHKDNRPTVAILPYGGTIMCAEQKDDNKGSILAPTILSLEGNLLRKINSSTINRLKHIEVLDSKYPLIDSQVARVDSHIAPRVEEIRLLLRENIADVLIVLYGTDTMTSLANAVHFGVSKDELEGKAVLLTCSMKHPEHPQTDAIRNFEQTVQLATYKEVLGTTGLSFGGRYSPYAHKKWSKEPRYAFASRFRRLAKYNKRKWVFDRERAQYDDVMGYAGRPFEMATGVLSIDLNENTDYKSLEQVLQTNRAYILNAPGDGGLRENELDDLAKAARNASGPIVIIGQAMRNAEAFGHEIRYDEEPDGVYAGDARFFECPNIIHGEDMVKSEVQTMLSIYIAQYDSFLAKQDGDCPISFSDFVAEQFATYVFKSPKMCTWKPKK